MTRPVALVVDDEPDILELIEITLGRMKIDTDSAGNVAQALERLEGREYDLCLTDMRLPDGDGIDLVRTIVNDYPRTPVAMFTAHGNMDTAIEALKAGAFDFVSKPVDLQDLRNLVDQALQLGPPEEQGGGRELLGQSPAMDRLRARIAKVARSRAPVAITGESGVGKELVARTIHRQGPRADGPFVPVNCGAIPRELVESELFGHERGSFTGAVADKEGLFAAARGGTLFLDEIAELPTDMQVKLLRAIQEKRIRPVGATAEVPIDIRLLSASHRNLEEEVAAGRLRHDLFYRINVIDLHVPPLRERTADIEPLARSILTRLAQDHERPVPKLDHQALEVLRAHPFPGNVRELENILERALTLQDGPVIRPDDLHLARSASHGTSPRAGMAPHGADEGADEEDPETDSLDSRLQQEQRRMLTATLEQHRWNRTSAARALGLTYRQLRYRLRKLGID